MELNREQIIKALECCTRGRKSKEDRPCLDCPYNECNLVGGTSERQTKGTCQGWLMKDALALIKELTKENEGLMRDKTALECIVSTARNQSRSVTVREMAERLDKWFCHDPAFLGVEKRLITDIVDRIAEEMLVEEK